MALPDPPIVSKMIAARKTFEQTAEETRKKLFHARVALPTQFRLSKEAWDQYMAWAVKMGKDSNLHAIFAGLPVLMDEDLPGLSVSVD